ncbi:hypothetical protein [Sphaerochaeta sp. PS]|uniref:hypothetical protein n=1 Tax=Sphaerochaeta sp. PS TaxID=3076336 RepID=UPI0028A354DE|nr:hypothetical protein [Sphaerochaeta sp. PS]MDT4761643.1 hypothetical protein [Sphaerochaeta sp. PS]
MDIHQDHDILLRHVLLQTRPHNLRIKRSRTRCRHTVMLAIPFKERGPKVAGIFDKFLFLIQYFEPMCSHSLEELNPLQPL